MGSTTSTSRGSPQDNTIACRSKRVTLKGCKETKCGGIVADLKVSSSKHIFKTAENVPLEYLKSNKVITCRVVNIVDGDTIRVRHTPGGQVCRHPTEVHTPWKGKLKDETILVRVYAVDAPEKQKFNKPGQPFSEEATKLLEDRLLNKIVYVKLLSVDHYGRILARILYVTEKYGGKTKGLSSTKLIEREQEQSDEILDFSDEDEWNENKQVPTPTNGNGSSRKKKKTKPSVDCYGRPADDTTSPNKRGAKDVQIDIIHSDGEELTTKNCCLNGWLVFFSCCKRRKTSKNGLPRHMKKGNRVLVERDICDDLLVNGLACVYTGGGAEYDNRYNELMKMEAEAKHKKRGMWGLRGSDLQLPGEFKKEHQVPSSGEWKSSPRGRGKSSPRGKQKTSLRGREKNCMRGGVRTGQRGGKGKKGTRKHVNN